MEYEIDTELEPNSDFPNKDNGIETATDNPLDVRAVRWTNQERESQKAVLIPEEEEPA